MALFEEKTQQEVGCSLCPGARTELRKRTIRGGSVQFVWQCLGCGEPVGSPVAKAKVQEQCGTLDVPAFDAELAPAMRQVARAATEQDDRARKEAWFAWYTAYLASGAWAEKRAKVMNRASGLCEGCGTAAATAVHHLTYDNVGAEFLFELVAICEPCHQRYHAAQEARAFARDRYSIPKGAA